MFRTRTQAGALILKISRRKKHIQAVECRSNDLVYESASLVISELRAYPSFYTVMQSHGNSFGEDLVLKIVNIASGNEESILDQIYEKQIFSDYYSEDFKQYSTPKQGAHNNGV